MQLIHPSDSAPVNCDQVPRCCRHGFVCVADRYGCSCPNCHSLFQRPRRARIISGRSCGCVSSKARPSIFRRTTAVTMVVMATSSTMISGVPLTTRLTRRSLRVSLVEKDAGRPQLNQCVSTGEPSSANPQVRDLDRNIHLCPVGLRCLSEPLRLTDAEPVLPEYQRALSTPTSRRLGGARQGWGRRGGGVSREISRFHCRCVVVSCSCCMVTAGGAHD